MRSTESKRRSRSRARRRTDARVRVDIALAARLDAQVYDVGNRDDQQQAPAPTTGGE